MQKLVKLQEDVQKEEQDIKDHLNSLQSGKLKDGKRSQRDFAEERITAQEKIIQNIQHLQDAENKCFGYVSWTNSKVQN